LKSVELFTFIAGFSFN